MDTMPCNRIACIRISDLNTFLNYEKKVQRFGNWSRNMHPYSSTEDEVCIIKTDSGVWCRAIYIRSTANNSCTVYCLDYGIHVDIPRSNVRVSNN